MIERVGVIDYGLANIRSVINAINCFPVEVFVAECGSELESADAVVLPGVGNFRSGMKALRERNYEECLNKLVIEDGRPFLGICLGLHFLFDASEEGGESGLGWVEGTVRRFLETPENKVPHMGWNEVEIDDSPCLFTDLEPPLDFYFAHSYHVPLEGVAESIVTAVGNYGVPFVAALERDNLHAVQFHPEKSQLAGMKLLENFLTVS